MAIMLVLLEDTGFENVAWWLSCLIMAWLSYQDLSNWFRSYWRMAKDSLGSHVWL